MENLSLMEYMQHASAARLNTSFMTLASPFNLATRHDSIGLKYQTNFIAGLVKQRYAAVEKNTMAQNRKDSLQSAARAQQNITGSTLYQFVQKKQSQIREIGSAQNARKQAKEKKSLTLSKTMFPNQGLTEKVQTRR